MSFDAPATGTPNGYSINVYRLGSNGTKTTATFAGSILTTSKTAAIPPGIMAANNGYVLRISAHSRGAIDLNTQPLRGTFPGGVADVLSGVIRP